MKLFFAKLLSVEPPPIPDSIATEEYFDQSFFEKKDKLFLCSRDIQVGDTYLYESYNGFTEDVSKSNFRNDSNPLCFKVIGEISPNAKWVKDGDEFDEKEVKIYKHDPFSKPFAINIKCPCCETFK